MVGPTPVNKILDEIIAQMGHQIPLTGISVEKRYTKGELVIEADADQLRQVFTNLVLNGIQAMPDGGTLTVSTRADSSAGRCVIDVADSGVGISAENQGQVFNPFFTTRGDGTGLGLSVSYGIIRAHGGNITVESSPGKGSLFRIVLPLTSG